MILLAVLLLLLVATRAAAAAPDERLAVRYADALTGEPRCAGDGDEGESDDDDADDDDNVDDEADADGDGGDDDACATREPRGAPDVEPRSASDSGGAISFDALADTDELGDGLVETDWIDDEAPPDTHAFDTGLAFTSSAFDDAAELRDVQLRHKRPSPWGRLDLSVAWRRAWNVTSISVKRDDAVWLVATWRR